MPDNYKKKMLLIYSCVFFSLFALLNSICCFSPNKISSSEFFSQYPNVRIDAADNSLEPGAYFCYGPFIFMPKGDYIFRCKGIAEGNNPIDIVCDGGLTTFYTGVYQVDKPVEVSISNDTAGLEIRVFYQEGTVSLENVSFQRLPDAKSVLAIVVLSIIPVLLFGMAYIIEKPIIRSVSELLLVFVYSLYAVVLGQSIITNRIYMTVCEWCGKFSILLINALIIMAVYFLLNTIFAKRYVSIIVVSVVIFLLFLIDLNYSNIRGDRFSIGEFLLVKYAVSVIGGFKLIWISLPIIVFLLFVIIFTITDFVIDKNYHDESRHIKNRMFNRLKSLLLCAMSFMVICALYRKAEIVDSLFVKDEYYDSYGYLMGLVQTRPRHKKKPMGYSEKAMEAIVKDIDTTDVLDNSEYPNIIFVQVETLYDLSNITPVTWDGDPYEELKPYMEENTSGYLLSPTSGGGTCNVEYEVLTGYPVSIPGGTPFESEIRSGYKSIVSILKEHGYYTMSLHLNTKQFFNREQAYRNLGFDSSIFSEEIAVPPERMINGWADDEFVYEQLINVWENRNSDVPCFFHVVTTQNHGGYDESYDKWGITVEGDIENNEVRQLQSYINQQKESSVQIKQLLDYFSKQDDRVIVVIWGDHCPGFYLFGINLDEGNIDNCTKERLTPLLIYSNFETEKKDLGVCAAYKVAPYVLDMVSIKNDVYMNYMYETEVPNYLFEDYIVDPNDCSCKDKSQWDEKQVNTRDEIEMLWYDRVHGKGYSDRD